ncbi:MAG: hypothetical protein M3Y22_12450, partial [Pseudomonadota bacterium]|nr:hypothetical protein [Pseudomonadota bacterium]
MTKPIPPEGRVVLCFSLLMLVMSGLGAHGAVAQTIPATSDDSAPQDIGTVRAVGDGGGVSAVPEPGTAAYVAPSRAPLNAS